MALKNVIAAGFIVGVNNHVPPPPHKRPVATPDKNVIAAGFIVGVNNHVPPPPHKRPVATPDVVEMDPEQRRGKVKDKGDRDPEVEVVPPELNNRDFTATEAEGGHPLPEPESSAPDQNPGFNMMAEVQRTVTEMLEAYFTKGKKGKQHDMTAPVGYCSVKTTTILLPH
ncbi:hypothetical protein Hamer_G018066 [Homarus americanus]|uniref:Uncharacterized protein n=1 Tax=Homarus americanus TaxID=6706 RepID=A0A8J5TLF1_HOMAM|nr:hypothetical protein Hamer_G018066 [Homarus americanus]